MGPVVFYYDVIWGCPPRIVNSDNKKAFFIISWQTPDTSILNDICSKFEVDYEGTRTRLLTNGRTESYEKGEASVSPSISSSGGNKSHVRNTTRKHLYKFKEFLMGVWFFSFNNSPKLQIWDFHTKQATWHIFVLCAIFVATFNKLWPLWEKSRCGYELWCYLNIKNLRKIQNWNFC